MSSPFFNFSSVKGVILDWDGVIAETRLDFGPIRDKYFGGKRVPLIEAWEKMDEPLRSQFMGEICAEEMRGASVSFEVEGIRDLIALLDGRGIKWCIHSRNCLDSILLAAKTIGFKLPPHTFSREAKHVKPDPRAMLDAAAAMDVPAANCLVVGDFLYELIAARRGGIRCALVREDDSECVNLADAVFERIELLTSAIKDGLEVVPWEYKRCAKLRGKGCIEKNYARVVHFDPEFSTKTMDALFALASSGLGHITVDGMRRVTIGEIENTPLLNICNLEIPAVEALKNILTPHFPLLDISEGTSGEPFSTCL